MEELKLYFSSLNQQEKKGEIKKRETEREKGRRKQR